MNRRHISKHLLSIVLLTFSTLVMDAKGDWDVDTVFLYNSWESIAYQSPDTFLLEPDITVRSPFDFEIKSQIERDKATNKMIKNTTICAEMDSNMWVINSKWIKDHFNGDGRSFSRYVPFFFNEKIAFVQFRRNEPTVGGALLNLLVDGVLMVDTGVGLGDGYNGESPKYYVLDFATHRVEEVDKKYLMSLLGAYPDLLRRYEMMNYNNSTDIINEYFIEYVHRITDDPEVPYIF